MDTLLVLAALGMVTYGVILWRNNRGRCRGCGRPMEAPRVVPNPRRGDTRKVWTCSAACEEKDYDGSVW